MLLSLLTAGARAQEVPAWFAPAAVAVSADGRILYAAGSRTAELLWMDTARGTVVREAELPDAATGLALDEAGGRLIVTYSGAGHRVVVFKESSGRVLGTLPAGVGCALRCWPGTRSPPPGSSTGGCTGPLLSVMTPLDPIHGST